MRSDNIIRERSFAFAISIINAYKYLSETKKEFILSKQLLKSGTSIGVNLEEAIGGQSSANFFHKISVSYKEARETVYWLKLLEATNYFKHEEAQSLVNEADEICRILGKIQLSLKSRKQKDLTLNATRNS